MLPWRVARFYWRARRHALRSGDRFSLASAARPAELAELLALAAGRQAVVELGTGTAWSAIALALDDRAPGSSAMTPAYAPSARRISRSPPATRASVSSCAPSPTAASRAPATHRRSSLFIDSEHEREPVLGAFALGARRSRPERLVVFHDYAHPDYPGVREAVRELALAGQQRARCSCGGLRERRASAQSATCTGAGAQPATGAPPAGAPRPAFLTVFLHRF